MNYETFIAYCNGVIDKTYEKNFNESLEAINNGYNKDYLSITQKQYALKTLKDEEYRSIKRFAKYFSKINNNITNYIKDNVDIYKDNYNFNITLNNFNWHKVDKQEFKKQVIPSTSHYRLMNARIVLYKDIVNAINSIDTIMLEDYKDNILGSTLSNLLKQMKSCGFNIEFDNKDILDYYSFIDYSESFKSDDTSSLGSLDYNPHDVYRFSVSMNKLKSMIIDAVSFLQDKLKNQSNSTNDTILGLLYYSLPQKNSNECIKTRLLRIAVLTGIFNTVCHYCFELDFETVNNLLKQSINSYHKG